MKKDTMFSRREVLALGGALGLSATVPGLLRPARAVAGLVPDPAERRYDAVVQVFLIGASSQLDTFDPKPGSSSNAFPTIDLGFGDQDRKAVRVTTFLRRIADVVGDGKGAVRFASLRSMHHATGAHAPAQDMMASFWSSPVGAAYPALPVVMNRYLEGAPGPLGLPSVVLSDPLGYGANDARGSILQPALEVVAETDPAAAMRLPVGVDVARATRRRDLLSLVSRAFTASRPDVATKGWADGAEQAHAMAVKGAAAKAFDLTGKALVAGSDARLQRRLTLARELVLAGVPYVALGAPGHDMHTDLKARLTGRWQQELDPGIAGLCSDLAASGKRVLVVVGGEFGRTPTSVSGGRDGRDHWAGAFSWGLLSINQPDFVSTAIGDTGPDGTWTEKKLVDPISPSAVGGLLYRVLGFPMKSETRVPLADGRLALPVDGYQATTDFEVTDRSTPITTPRLMRRLFQSIV